MTRNEWEQRKRRLEEQRREGLELLETFYRQQLLALEMVWQATSEEDGILARFIAPPETPRRKRREAGELLAEVEAAEVRRPRGSGRQRPSASKQPPSSSKQRRSTSKQGPSISKQPPNASKQSRSTSKQSPNAS